MHAATASTARNCWTQAHRVGERMGSVSAGPISRARLLLSFSHAGRRSQNQYNFSRPQSRLRPFTRLVIQTLAHLSYQYLVAVNSERIVDMHVYAADRATISSIPIRL